VDVTVGLGIEAVTADGSDISMPMSVTFLANQQYASIDVSMLTEPCDEEEIETLRLKILTVPAGVVKGYPVVYTINIQDMDPTPTLDFELANSNRAEDGGAAAVNVYLSQPSCREVIFTYTAEDITTTENVDYTLQLCR
jgi:hypothetical protein